VRRALTVAFTVVLAAGGCSNAPDSDTAVLAIITGNGLVRTGTLQIARTESERERGLAGRPSIPPNGGMVFLQGEPSDDGFWMRGVTVPLSIAFWDGDGRIVAIMDMQPCREEPCELYFPGRSYVGAVEMRLGWFDRHDVEVGDVVHLEYTA